MTNLGFTKTNTPNQLQTQNWDLDGANNWNETSTENGSMEHSSTKMAEIYAHLADTDYRKAVQALDTNGVE